MGNRHVFRRFTTEDLRRYFIVALWIREDDTKTVIVSAKLVLTITNDGKHQCMAHLDYLDGRSEDLPFTEWVRRQLTSILAEDTKAHPATQTQKDGTE